MKDIKQQIVEMTECLARCGVTLAPSPTNRSDEEQMKLLNKIFREMVA
jgi:hypothetical protein